MNHLSNLHEKESFVKSISDLKKLLVDTMYDYTKIIPSKLCVPSYLNLYVTLQNACELTQHKSFGGSGEEECLSFYKFQKFLMSSKDKTLGKLWCICMCVICNHNMKGNFFLKRTRVSPHSIYPYNIANTRNFYILYK